MNMDISSQKGFTLIELMVVILIIGILVAIALPNFIGAQERAHISSVKTNAKTLQTSIEIYSVDYGGIYPRSIPEITGHEAYKILHNPITTQTGVADVSGKGAWRTDSVGIATAADTDLLNFQDSASIGLVKYVGMDTAGAATTQWAGDGSSGNTNPTHDYMIFICDRKGGAVRRFLLTPGSATAAGSRLLAGH